MLPSGRLNGGTLQMISHRLFIEEIRRILLKKGVSGRSVAMFQPKGTPLPLCYTTRHKGQRELMIIQSTIISYCFTAVSYRFNRDETDIRSLFDRFIFIATFDR